MEITITDDNGFILKEIVIDEDLQKQESELEGESLVIAITDHIESRFETK